MKRNLTILFTILTLCAYSQTLRTFNGPFNDGKSQNGTAIYTYYEDPVTREYVRQGAFKYSFIGKGDYNGYNQTITGSFEKGLKNGTWTYKITMTDFGTNNPYYTGTVLLVANYKNGYADGNWKEVNSYKTRKRYFTYGQYAWDAFGPIKTTTIELNFKKGYFAGSCNINDEFSKYKVSGNFNDSSFYTGTWIVNDINNSEEVFKDNFYYECVIRNKNGELLKLDKYYEDYDLFLKAKSMTNDERKDAGFEIVTKCGLSGIKEYFSKVFQNEYFLYEEIGGDLSFKEGFKGGCQYNLVKKQYESILTNKNYLEAEDYIKKNQLKDAMHAYNYILKNNYNIKPSEKTIVEKKFIDVKTKFIEEIKPYVANNKYFKEYLKSQKDSLDEDFNNKAKEYGLKNNDALYCFNENTWENAKNCLKRYIILNLNEIPKLYYFENYFNYKLTIDNEKKQCIRYSEEIDTLQYSYRDKAEFEKNMNNAKNNYQMAISIKDLFLTALNNKNKIETLNIQNNKKTLFAKYSLLLQDFVIKYNTYLKIDDCYKLLIDLNSISNKVITLYSVESKEIEKQLKDSETVDQIRQILIEK